MPQNTELNQTLEALISENESGLFSVWRKYHIDKPLTSNNLLLAYYRFGEPFAKDVDHVLGLESFSGQTIKGLFDLGVKALTAASAVNSLSEDEDGEDHEDKENIDTTEKTVMGIPSRTFNIGLFVAALLTIFLIINYTKK